MLHVVNDHVMVEITSSEYKFGGGEENDLETGIVVAMPDKLNFFGFHSFAFEDSLLVEDKLDKLYQYYQGMVGKRIFWKSLSARGMMVKHEDKLYAAIKMTDIIFVTEEVNTDAYNIEGKAGGAFAV